MTLRKIVQGKLIVRPPVAIFVDGLLFVALSYLFSFGNEMLRRFDSSQWGMAPTVALEIASTFLAGVMYYLGMALIAWACARLIAEGSLGKKTCRCGNCGDAAAADSSSPTTIP